jgi:hypothetical protein
MNVPMLYNRISFICLIEKRKLTRISSTNRIQVAIYEQCTEIEPSKPKAASVVEKLTTVSLVPSPISSPISKIFFDERIAQHLSNTTQFHSFKSNSASSVFWLLYCHV